MPDFLRDQWSAFCIRMSLVGRKLPWGLVFLVVRYESLMVDTYYRLPVLSRYFLGCYAHGIGVAHQLPTEHV